MGIEIRNATPDEFQAAVEVMSAAFLEPLEVRNAAEALPDVWDPERTWVAWDEGQACGTFRSWGTHLTVPGGSQVPAAAVAAVTVLPTHRRRGILTRLAAAEHAALRERGEAVGLLHASEYPIYGRFGYAPGTRHTAWQITTHATRMRGETTGTVQLVAPDAAARDQARAVFEAWRVRQPGEIWRRDASWDLALGLAKEPWAKRWQGWIALHRDAHGRVDGYARYTGSSEHVEKLPRGTIEVNELHALTPDAEADLVRYLLSMDLVATVKLDGRRPRERFTWLLDNARAARITETGDGMWVRLFDVPRALEARRYEHAASMVIEVVDDEAWGGTRRYALDAGPQGATCAETDREPALTIPVAALSGAYLGGTRLVDLAVAVGADEHRDGALVQADALFRTADDPWCSTHF